MITKNYSNLFSKKKKKKENTEDNKRNNRFQEFKNKDKIDSKFKWHDIVYTLLTELNKTDKDVYKMNYISCLNWLSYFKERDEVIKNSRK